MSNMCWSLSLVLTAEQSIDSLFFGYSPLKTDGKTKESYVCFCSFNNSAPMGFLFVL